MARLLLVIGLILLAFPTQASARLRNVDAVRVLSGTDGLIAFDVAPDGCVYIAALDDTVIADSEKNLSRVLKFLPSGELVWSQFFVHDFGSIGPGAVLGLPDGGVMIAGSVGYQTVAGTIQLSPRGRDVMLARLGGDGSHLWARLYGNNSNQFARCLVRHPAGDVILGAVNWGTIDLGGGLQRTNGAGDIVLARLRLDGSHVWTRSYGQTGLQEVHYLDVGADGSMILTGRLEGLMDFGGGVLTNGMTQNGFIAMLDPDLGHVMSASMTGSGWVLPSGLARAPDGSAVLAGAVRGPINFAGQSFTLPDLTPFVASFAMDGLRWLRPLDAAISTDGGLGITSDGTLFTLGNYDGPVQIGGEEIAPAAAILVAYEPSGEPRCATGIGTAGDGDERLLAMHGDRVVMTGLFTAPVDFGRGLHTPTFRDLFIARFENWQPPRVHVTAFSAIAKGGNVAVRWTIQSEDELGTYRLVRRGPGDVLVVLDSGTAMTGETSHLDRTAVPGREYTYEFSVANVFGDAVTATPVVLTVPVPSVSIEQNVPNPFNPSTSIAYSLATPGRVALVIYNVDGSLVRRLDQGARAQGHHTAYWNGYDAVGRPVASGVYIYRLEGAVETAARRMILLR